MTSDELRPCPFCGQRQGYHVMFGAYVLNRTDHARRCITRRILGETPLTFMSYAEMTSAWNRRAIDE